MNLKDRAKKLKTDIPAVFIAMKKRETPLAAKIFASVTVLYALSPIDLIPDFIPVLGFLDDLIILPAMIAFTVKRVATAVFKQAQIESEGLWENGKPKKWYYALPIAAIWLLILALAARAIIF